MQLGGFSLGGMTRRLKRGDESSDEDEFSGSDPASDREGQELALTRDMKDWIEVSAGGELDIYTCIGLSNGRDKFGPRTRQMVPVMFMLMFLQLLLPSLLMSWYAGAHDAPSESGIEFRIIGFGLYGYAVYGMYGSALDECRSRFLQLGIEHNISPWYTLPMLVGEFSNAFTGCILTLALFAIFCASTTPVDLILNSLAVNFLVSADNDFSEDAVRDAAKADFRNCMAHEINAPVTAANKIRNSLMSVAMCLCSVMRMFGICLVGFIFSFTFLFGAEEQLCNSMPDILQRVLPFCTYATP